MRLAILSPNKNPYSETFIQAHKNLLKDEVCFYYGNDGILLENHGVLAPKYFKFYVNFLTGLFNRPSSFVRESLLKYSFKKNKIDVVLVEYGTHAHHLRSFLKTCGLPVVVHFHGYDASVHKTIEACGDYKEVFNVASKIIVVSKIMESKLKALGCPHDKLVYTPCAPNSKFLSIEPTYSKNQFISVGRFTDKKAPYYTILAFKEVIKKYPSTILLMAGSGILYDTCKNLVNYYGLSDNIKFLGVISPNDFGKLLSESLAFVQHSITAMNGDMEGTPVTVLEASAAGLPVISTFHAGIPDVIVDGKTGLLCDEHDVNKMAEHMIALLKDKQMAVTLGKNGKERVKSLFNMDTHISIVQEALELAYKEEAHED